MKCSISKAAVLGAGVMGATIAAHLANVGIPTYLLDIVPKQLTPDEEKNGFTLDSPQVRNRLAANSIAALLKAKPAPFYVPENAALLTPGNFEDNMDVLAECDWVIEVVVERLDIKQKLLKKWHPLSNQKPLLLPIPPVYPLIKCAKGCPKVSSSISWVPTFSTHPAT